MGELFVGGGLEVLQRLSETLIPPPVEELVGCQGRRKAPTPRSAAPPTPTYGSHRYDGKDGWATVRCGGLVGVGGAWEAEWGPCAQYISLNGIS